jgi:hypothetical protein
MPSPLLDPNGSAEFCEVGSVEPPPENAEETGSAGAIMAHAIILRRAADVLREAGYTELTEGIERVLRDVERRKGC